MEDYYFNQIADDYHNKRKKPWKPLEEFMKIIEENKYFINGICLDLGCGNGRNFKTIRNSADVIVALDNSIKLLKIVKESETRPLHLILADMPSLPLRPKSLNAIFYIAAYHHLDTLNKRKIAMLLIKNTLIEKGFLILTAWRKWRKTYRKYFFINFFKRLFFYKYRKVQKERGLRYFGDIFIPWTISSENKTINRFYHLFSKREILRLLKIFSLKQFRLMGGSTNKDNYFILAQKE